jgi:hypothetical protein
LAFSEIKGKYGKIGAQFDLYVVSFLAFTLSRIMVRISDWQHANPRVRSQYYAKNFALDVSLLLSVQKDTNQHLLFEKPSTVTKPSINTSSLLAVLSMYIIALSASTGCHLFVPKLSQYVSGTAPISMRLGSVVLAAVIDVMIFLST